jgi:hypothetical protein
MSDIRPGTYLDVNYLCVAELFAFKTPYQLDSDSTRKIAKYGSRPHFRVAPQLFRKVRYIASTYYS